MTFQHRCFAVLAAAVKAAGDSCEPDFLFRRVIEQVHLATDVRLRHGCIVHDSLQVTLVCGDTELEVQVRCAPEEFSQVLAIEDALDAEAA